jgi:MYXO-CTERM domain-containing protein
MDTSMDDRSRGTSTVRRVQECTLAALLLVGSAHVAHASIVQPLSPTELSAGAERIAIGTITEVATRWSADHTRLESVVTLATDDGDALTIVQPGGELGDVRQVVVGMPSYRVGARARYFLRHNLDGATWRVFGWSQGQWPERVVAGTRIYVPGPHPDGAAFTTNGMVWPAARMPVPYLINNVGSDDLSLVQIRSAVTAAFQSWQDVPCASITYRDAGDTTLGVAVDGQNVILFIESGWIYGAEAAGATALTIVDGMQTADVAMNGQNFHWALGPSGALAASGTFDLQGVLTHELGHFSGLGHTMSSHDTMYYSWTPWVGQRTPSLDDKLGLCSIYPVAGDECTDSTGCASGETCATTAAGRLCSAPAATIGTACNYDAVECNDFCLFTAADLSTGYCSRFCASDADCPLTHHCAPASAGTMTVMVCFAGAQPLPIDAGTGACTVDQECPSGEYCGAASACTLDCRSEADCPGQSTCDPHGRCDAAPSSDHGGCGCGTAPRDASIIGVLIAGLLLRRRRKERSRPLAS